MTYKAKFGLDQKIVAITTGWINKETTKENNLKYIPSELKKTVIMNY